VFATVKATVDSRALSTTNGVDPATARFRVYGGGGACAHDGARRQTKARKRNRVIA
jgi:hypothetical protein